MFYGTTIEELIQIVAKAEEHAREMPKVEPLRLEPAAPAFFCEPPQSQALIGVA